MMSPLFLALVAAAQAVPPSWVPDARFALALYCPTTCEQERLDSLEQALTDIPSRRRLPRAASEPSRSMGLASAQDFGLPDLDLLGSLADGLGKEGAAALESSQEVLVVSFAAPREQIRDLVTLAYPAFLALAQANGGVVEELGTGRLYDSDSFAEQAGNVTAEALDTSWFFVLEASGEEGQDDTDLETMGLRSLGLHELRIEGVSSEELDDNAALLNAVAQLSWEQGGLSERSWVAEAAIELPAARHRSVGIEGTAYATNAQTLWSTSVDPVALVAFDGRFDADPADPLNTYPTAQVDQPEPEPDPEPEPEPEPKRSPASLDSHQGDRRAVGTATDDTPTTTRAPATTPTSEIPDPDPTSLPEPTPAPPTLLDVQASSLSRLDGAVRLAWNAGLPPDDSLYVKAPFAAADGSIEYLWVQVVAWDGSTLNGVLRSEPRWADQVVAGDEVVVDQTQVFDYLWRHADGSAEGNETEAFLH